MELDMPAWLYGTLRTLAQSGAGALVAYLASKGVNLPVEAQSWIAQFVIYGGAIALATAALKWLESRKGDSLPARAARALAKLVMLGLTGKQPVYADRTSPNDSAESSPAAVVYRDGRSSPALR
jgi:hypothetical protein